VEWAGAAASLDTVLNPKELPGAPDRLRPMGEHKGNGQSDAEVDKDTESVTKMITEATAAQEKDRPSKN
jgi:hypothetical protein